MHVLTCFPKITYGDCIQKTCWGSGLWEFCWNEEGIEEGMGLFLECWGNRSVERRLRERERESLEILLSDRSKKPCLLRDCWETVERLLREWECWENVGKLLLRLLREWECERSLRDCCETVDRTKTSFNSLQHPQQHSSDITPKIFSNSHRITQKHLSDISQTFLNITQTSLKHLSTTFINILQTISDNITLIITNQNLLSPQENLWIIYGSSMDNLRIIYG